MELLELVTSLRDRYQVYAGEYRKPNLRQELYVLGVDNDLWLTFYDFIAEIVPTIEFLAHEGCFHPDVLQWYHCEHTTAAEFGVLMSECILILEGKKHQWQNDKNNASSVSIVPEN